MPALPLFEPKTEECAMAQDQARIWYQSFVHPVEQAPYMERLQSLLDRVASPGVRFEVHGLDPPDRSLHRLGLVTIDPIFIPWHDRQVKMHGLGERVVGTTALKMNLPAFMKAFTDEAAYATVRAQFVAQVKPLIDAGAEVVVPAGGLPMLLFARESPFIIDGAPVLNGIAVVAKAAEMALALKAITKVVVSRRSTYAKASPEAISDFLAR
jgi:hypothetical protein